MRFRHRSTGLKWDPVSLADIFALIQGTNILSDFGGTENQTYPDQIQNLRQFRLGYRKTSHRPSDIFDTIGEEHVRVDGYPHVDGVKNTQQKPEKPVKQDSLDLEDQRPVSVESFEHDFEARSERYRFVPRYLRESYVVAWITVAAVLTIALLAVSFVHHPLAHGFMPLLPAAASSSGFSPADFLYSFLPSFLGMLLFLLFQPIDLAFRALEPYAHLANANGATAEQSLLLDYPSSFPIAVTIKATLAGHVKVAWLSLMATISITLPILGGGVFTAQFFPATQDVRIAASMPGYDALVFFVLLYALSFLIIWPGRKRHLPHDFRTLGQVMGFVYCSRLLQDSLFRDIQSKTDLATRLLAGQRIQGDEKAKYAFGLYDGWDGKRRLGIDQVNSDLGLRSSRNSVSGK